MGAPDAPSGAGATPSREPETVTFAARDASSGPDSDLVSRVFLRCAWRHDDRSFDVTLVAPGTGDEPPTVWRAANCRQPSNVRFHNWYDRAVGALASLEAEDHFRFEFAPKTRSAGTSAGALPGGVGAFLRASDAVDAARAPPPTTVLRWTWHEPPYPAGTKGDAGDEGRFLPARLKKENREDSAETKTSPARTEDWSGRRSSNASTRTRIIRVRPILIPDRRLHKKTTRFGSSRLCTANLYGATRPFARRFAASSETSPRRARRRRARAPS
jgi:hypothetical protein